MANPVMNKIVKDWSTQSSTPAGYPTMPGYQPASQQAPNPLRGTDSPVRDAAAGGPLLRSADLRHAPGAGVRPAGRLR